MFSLELAIDVEAYFLIYSYDYQMDEAQKQKFGLTWAPKKFLIRH